MYITALATAMTIASIAMPEWLSYWSTSADGESNSKHIGLHYICSNLDNPPCRVFPREEQCQGDGRYFCSVWRTVGFLVSVAAIFHLVGLVSFVIVLAGGKYKREIGWRVLSPGMLLVAVIEFAALGVVVSLFFRLAVLFVVASRANHPVPLPDLHAQY